MAWEIEFDNMPIGYAVTAGKSGDNVTVCGVEFTSTEDGQHFISRLEGFPDEVLKLVAQTSIKPSTVDHMLVIVRPDKTATAYINELEITGYMQAKKSVLAGEEIYCNDVADITEIRLSDIEIQDKHGFLFLFSIGWRQGLYFDFLPLSPHEDQSRSYCVSKRLARYYLYLMFQERFNISENAWDHMFCLGWFPFISLSNSSVMDIVKYAENSWNIDELILQISTEVSAGLPKWLEKWKNRPQFESHITFLETAIERFESEDYISTVSILYPRIEGIMRDEHLSSSSGEKATQVKLVESTLREVEPEKNPKMLLLPDKFKKYLDEIYFANFDPSDAKGASRNTISHGVANEQEFSKKSACIAFLIIEQITYCLSGD